MLLHARGSLLPLQHQHAEHFSLTLLCVDESFVRLSAFMHLANAFVQSDLDCIQGISFITSCITWCAVYSFSKTQEVVFVVVI